MSIRQRSGACEMFALVILVCMTSVVAAQSSAKNLVGTWELNVIDSKQARTIKLFLDKGQLRGTYIDGDGKQLSLDRMKLDSSTLEFYVASVGDFSFKGNGEQLRGVLKSEASSKIYKVALRRMNR